MPLLDIIEFPDERLRKIAQPVTEFSNELRTLVDDMLETMYAAPGIGLAATQIDVHRRIIVIDVSEDKNEPMVFINPKLLWQEGSEESEEGCLSVPGIYEVVQRAEAVKVKAFDQHGEAFQMEAHELLAVCIQHEIDHLNGKVFIDHISALKRNRAQKKLIKQKKQDAKD